MRFFKTVIFQTTIMLIIFMLCGCASGSSSNSEILSSSLNTMLKHEWDLYRVNKPGIKGGITLRVISKEGTFFSSYGMDNEITENVHFRTASVTKTFTAASILLLQQRGLLNIEDTLASNMPVKSEPYLPDTPGYAIPYKGSITIRQLLEHRAGVFDVNNTAIPADSHADYAGKNYITYTLKIDPEHTFTFDESIGVIAANNLSYTPPGDIYHYSDTGYSILGKIIERVSGESYVDFVTKNLLQPNNLNNSSLPFTGTDQVIPSPAVFGYNYYDEDSGLVTKDNVSFQVANGNLITTPADLAEWAHKLYTGKAGLNSEYVKMMMNVKPLADPATGYGLGCSYIKGLGYGHSGAIQGYLSSMIYDPDNDITIVIFTNVINWEDTTGQLLFFRDVAFKTREALGYPGNQN